MLSWTIGGQDLLSRRMDIVFEHGVFVCLSKQVVHYCRRLLCERLKEWRAQVDALLEDMHDGIHVAGLHLEHSLFESFHEVSE